MMQFNVGGELLDMYADTSLTFTKKNILFAFDSIECERSTSFSIPATVRNNSILQLACDEHTTGAQMRVQIDAQMQADGVSKDGIIYVDSYDHVKHEYKCIFLTGELLGLLRIRNAGKIADIIPASELLVSAVWDDSISVWYDDSDSTALLRPYYTQNYGSYLMPSISLQWLVDKCLSALGLSFSFSALSKYRVLMHEPKTPTGTLSVAYTNYGAYASSYSTSNRLNTMASGGEIVQALFNKQNNKIRYLATTAPNYMYAYIQQLVPKNDIDISFPSDWDDDVFVLSFPQDCAELPTDDPDVYKKYDSSLAEWVTYPWTIGVFLGDRSFFPNSSSGNLVVSGESLRGRTITIPKGTPFVFIDKSVFEYYIDGAKGWYDFVNNTNSVTLLEGDAKQGDTIQLSNNLPDITLIDLFKTGAALAGGVLNYTDADGLLIDTLANNFSTFEKHYLDDVIEVGEMKRTFGDYAQNNVVSFAGDETQFASDKITRVYTISNVNIEQSKELYTIPFSEGSAHGTTTLHIRNTEENPSPSAFVIGYYSTYQATRSKLNRVSIPSITGISSLCSASTMLSIKAMMPLLTFVGITARTKIYYDGVWYVWTEAQWQKGVVTLKLSKI